VPRGESLEVRHVDRYDGDVVSDLTDFDAGVVAGPDPLPVLRQLRAMDPTIQLIALAEKSARDALQRSIMFSPGLGEIWLADAAEVDAELLERAAGVTAARRDYRTMRQRAASDLSAIEAHPARRAVVSDAFLAALLRGMPDPIIALDADGCVLTWNAAAERLLGVSRQDATGRRFTEVIDIVDEGTPEPRGGGTARLVRFSRRTGESGHGVLLSLPIQVEGRRITALVLHDETALRRALNARSRFYSAMSHELRTPINAIIGYNSLLLEGIYGEVPETQRVALGRAQRAANHLLELVNDVLDIAKIDAGRMEIALDVVSVPTLIAELLDTVSALAAEHGSDLVMEKTAAPCRIATDPRRVRQILLNLLSNAVKFGRGEPVHVRWRALPNGGVDISIEDRGPGIAPEDRERIFHEFEQVRSTADAPESATGTGLGLSISNRLAALLGGEILLDSEPGRGSTFTLRLPPQSLVPDD
jgi:PAS domain S-box-containing protein